MPHKKGKIQFLLVTSFQKFEKCEIYSQSHGKHTLGWIANNLGQVITQMFVLIIEINKDYDLKVLIYQYLKCSL